MTHPAPLSLEQMLTSPEGFGLTTATDVQRAICRAADGEAMGALWKSAKVRRAFGNQRPDKKAPHIMTVLAGIRGGKSLIAAAKALCGSQNVDVSHCSEGDLIRLPVLSTEVDLARAIFSHIKGALLTSPLLKQLLVGDPKVDSVNIRHPSGKIVEIKVTAMSRAGTTLVARWLAGCVFDEAPRMLGDGSVKSLNESLRAISGRILPGGQIWCIGSPHAPFGPVYDMYSQHFGKTGGATIVVKAPGPALNPYWWTKERIEEIKQSDPKAHRTDVLAEFADAEEALIASVSLEKCTRPGYPEPDPAVTYCAAMDPGTRGNAWTLVVLGRVGTNDEGLPILRVVHNQQWVGTSSAPLSPRRTVQKVVDALRPYWLDEVFTDQYSLDAIVDLGELVGLTVTGQTIDADNRLEMASFIALLLDDTRLLVPEDREFRADLLSAKKRLTQNGATLVLPQSGDGRHCDYLPSLMLTCANHPDAHEEPPEEDDHGPFAAVVEELQSGGADSWSQAAHGLMS